MRLRTMAAMAGHLGTANPRRRWPVLGSCGSRSLPWPDCAYKSPGCRTSSDFIHEVPRDSIVALDVRSGSNGGKDALMGAAIGGAVSFLAGALADEGPPGGVLSFTVLGATDGALLGRLFGSMSPRWRPVAP